MSAADKGTTSAVHHDWHTDDEANRKWRDCDKPGHEEGCYVMTCLVCDTDFPDCEDSLLVSDDCQCGRDSHGDIGEPPEHDDNCPVWLSAVKIVRANNNGV